MADSPGVGAPLPSGVLPAAAFPLPPRVLQFRQIVLWPIQLIPHARGEQIQRHWELLEKISAGRWTEVADEFTDDPENFSERHYKEFVTFLPYVQRLLYGEGQGDENKSLRPMRVFRRSDVAQARVLFPGDDAPTHFDVAHVDLHFFYDIDVAILALYDRRQTSTEGLKFSRSTCSSSCYFCFSFSLMESSCWPRQRCYRRARAGCSNGRTRAVPMRGPPSRSRSSRDDFCPPRPSGSRSSRS